MVNAQEMEENLSPVIRRPALYAGGWVALAMGIIGIFVPLWPTTCFLLLSGWCFSKSSTRMYLWLRQNGFFGEYLRGYQDQKVISKRVRSTSALVLWAFILITPALLDAGTLIWAILLTIGVGVTVHLYSLDTIQPVRAASRTE